MSGGQDALREALVEYAMHYGPRCRECADNDGLCPMSGLPCGGRRKATEFVVDALLYGAAHGHCPAALASSTPKPDAGEMERSKSDWFAGDVDCDGNELVTIRADELQRLRDEREKFMWQVRDTCARAEKAEAAALSRPADAERLVTLRQLLDAEGVADDLKLAEARRHLDRFLTGKPLVNETGFAAARTLTGTDAGGQRHGDA